MRALYSKQKILEESARQIIKDYGKESIVAELARIVIQPNNHNSIDEQKITLRQNVHKLARAERSRHRMLNYFYNDMPW